MTRLLGQSRSLGLLLQVAFRKIKHKWKIFACKKLTIDLTVCLRKLCWEYLVSDLATELWESKRVWF